MYHGCTDTNVTEYFRSKKIFVFFCGLSWKPLLNILCSSLNDACTNQCPDEFSEDLLSAHESELDRMRGFYQDNKEIFDLLQKRDKLWQQQVELDVRTKTLLHTAMYEWIVHLTR